MATDADFDDDWEASQTEVPDTDSKQGKKEKKEVIDLTQDSDTEEPISPVFQSPPKKRRLGYSPGPGPVIAHTSPTAIRHFHNTIAAGAEAASQKAFALACEKGFLKNAEYNGLPKPDPIAFLQAPVFIDSDSD